MKYLIPIALLGIGWTLFIALGFINGFLLLPITFSSESASFKEKVAAQLEKQHIGNLALVLIENGEVKEELYYGRSELITSKSIFPVASISKLATAIGVLKLQEKGLISLDAPVEVYLTRWHLPASAYNHKQVTIRRLLSHSSGLIDDLGYGGFDSKDEMQSIEESLTKAADSDYSDGVAIIGMEPGGYMYSGAGYTLLQLVIEEVTGLAFEDFMQQEVFEPLQITHSTFDQAQLRTGELVKIYQENGETRPFKWFTAQAAASLLTSSADLSKLLIALVEENQLLTQESISAMATAVTYINHTPIYGLGPYLYSQNDPNSLVIGHDGSGNDAINAAARIDLQSKDGIIILETGNYNLASNYADEWLYWKTGVADFVVMNRNKKFLLALLLIGYTIIASGVYFSKRRMATSPTTSH